MDELKTLGDRMQQSYKDKQTTDSHTQEHDELLTGLDRVQRAVINSGVAQIQAHSSHQPEVTVLNPTESVLTPDVDKVVKAVKELIALEKNRKAADLKPILKQLVKIVPMLESLPSKIEFPEEQDTIEVSNLHEIGQKIEDMTLSIKAWHETQVNQPIQVEAPAVSVTNDVDLSPIEVGLESIRAAVDNIPPTIIPVDDDSEILQGLADVKEAITSLRFPIPNVPTDPLVRYKIADEDTQTSLNYFGYVANDGTWVIMRRDITNANVTADRYASGSNDYPGSWTSRATLTYGYLYNALY